MKKLVIILLLVLCISSIFSESYSERILFSGISETYTDHTLSVLATTLNRNLILSFQNLPEFSFLNISSNINKQVNISDYTSPESHSYLISGVFSKTLTNEYTVSVEIENLTTSDKTSFTDSFDTPNEVFMCSDRISNNIIDYFVQNNGNKRELNQLNRKNELSSLRIHFFQFNENLIDSCNKRYFFKGPTTYCPDRHENNNAALLVSKKASGILKKELNFLPYNNFTISAWIKLDNDKLTDYGRIIDCMDWNNKTGFNIIVASNNSIINFSYFSTNHKQVSISSCESLLRDRWYNIVVTFKNGTSCLYLNGILQEKLNTTDVIAKSIRYLSIGNGYEGYPSYYLSGCIDDIEVFNTDLSASEVEYIYSEEI